jgi:hypothetical protein
LDEMRAIGVTLLFAIALFALLVQLAIARYPGGTWFDPSAPGHDLFRNFLCDLTQPIALNGRLNPGAGFAKSAMIVLDAALLGHWLAIPELCSKTSLARPLRAAAIVSFLGIVAVPLTPSLRLGVVHSLAVLAGTVPGIAAGMLATYLLARSPHRWLFRLGAAVLIVATIDAVLYFAHTALGGPPPLLVPVLQRVALVLLLTWMTAVAVTLVRRSSRGC